MATDHYHVAFATSDAYLPYAATAIRSCVRHLPVGRAQVHVLHDGQLRPEDARRLEEVVAPWGGRIDLHLVSPVLTEGIPILDRFGGAVVWLPMALPRLLPHVERVVYLDADLLVVDELAGLWQIDLGGHPLGAVANVLEPTARPRLEDLGLPSGAPVLNSGVLVMDLDRWRSEALAATVLGEARRRGVALEWADQDALNLALVGRWQAIDPRWNAQQSLWVWRAWADEVFGAAAVDAAVAHPAIVHFEGPLGCKPWHYLSTHQWREAFRAEQAATPWRDVPLEDRTIATRAIRRLPEDQWIPNLLRLLRWRERRDRAKARTTAGLSSIAMSRSGEPPVVRSFRAGPLDVTVRLPAAVRRLRRAASEAPAALPRLELPDDRPSFTVTRNDPAHWMKRWEASPELEARQAALAAQEGPLTLEEEVTGIGWYHTLELPGGIVTPGIFDHRELVQHYGLPADLSGRTAIDVATFDGFWAFELERRGAQVTAVDLPTLAGLDLNSQMRDLFREKGLDRDPSAGFHLASRALGSNVTMHKSSVYDLSPETVGQFDFAHMGDLLLHLRDPIRALERVQSIVCPGGTAHIVDSYEPELAGQQATRYEGGWDLGTWWTPSLDMLAQALIDVGFADVHLFRTYRANWTDEVGRWRAILIATN